ncbi:hypothetical protein TNCV_3556191 [Trichonephila clavipes]|nr:hypothetical protein TNCV_3556191 [Trichonephila clavipes]
MRTIIFVDVPQFQQDTARDHTAAIVRTSIAAIDTMPWPAALPNSPTIENLSDATSHSFKITPLHFNFQTLLAKVQSAWDELSRNPERASI